MVRVVCLKNIGGSMSKGGGGGSQDFGEGFVIVAFAICIGFVFFYDYIEIFFLNVWRNVRIVEFSLFAWIPEYIPFLGDYGKVVDSLSNLPKSELHKVKRAVDIHYAWPFALASVLIMFYMSFNLFTKTNTAKTRYDMETLLARWYGYVKNSKVKDWDKIININKNDNKETEHPEMQSHVFDGTNHMYADPSSPWKVATETHLFSSCSKGVKIYDEATRIFDTDLARMVFDEQLNTLFTSFDDMTPVEKYCFNYIAHTISVRTRIPLVDAKKRCIEIMESHAYTRCGLVSILDEARKSGELVSNKFSFIKRHDRVLFICFSTLGRKLPFTESAGCFAHRELEKALSMKMVSKETTAAIEALAESIGVDLSKNKKDFSET